MIRKSFSQKIPKFYLFLFIFTISICGLMADAALAKEREVKVGIYNNSPKVFMNSDSQPDGILVDILKVVAVQEKWHLTYVNCYWHQCLSYLQDGTIDLLPDVAFSENREEFLDFNNTPSLYSWTQFYAKEETNIISLFDLKGKRIAVLDGSIQESFVGDWLKKFNVTANIIPFKSLDDVLKAVANGNADAGIVNNYYGDFNAQKYQLIPTPIMYQPVQLFFATAKGKNADLLEPFDKKLLTWLNSSNSRYVEILKKWRGKNPEPFISKTIWRIGGFLIGLLALFLIATILLRWQVKLKVKKLLETQAELKIERDLAQQYLDIAAFMLIALDVNGCISMVNKMGVKILGLPENELLGMNWFEHFIPENQKQELQKLFDQLMTGEVRALDAYENSIVTAYGKILWMSWHNTLLKNETGQVIGILGSAEDVTQAKIAESQLKIAAAAFETQEGIIISNKYCIIERVNQSFSRMTGYEDQDLLGKEAYCYQSERHPKELSQLIKDAVDKTGGWDGDIWWVNKDGQDHPYRVSVSTVVDAEGDISHYVCTYVDRKELRQSEDKIKQLAFYDQLTNLPNRALLLDRLRQLMVSSSRSQRHSALLFLDLDHFKTLNDTMGHDMGDILLQQVASRLQSCVRESDTVARFGGDEFVILLASIHSSAKEAAALTEVVAGKILSVMLQPFTLKEISYRSTLSIGVTIFCGLEPDLDTLLKQADLAMYKAKDTGRNAARFFDPEMEVVVMQRALIEKDLRQAIQEKQFLLHYQAQIAGSQITGAEVLLRWQHPIRGLVFPGDFISIAEETAMIVPIGQWVLETACQQLALWAKQENMSHLTIAVNVSAHQFSQTNFVSQVMTAIESADAPANRLKLELTESLLVTNVDDVIEKMFALKAKGVGFSLDDFGTGYSSLSYLKRLPLDQLKIDQSFVRDVLVDTHDAAIAKTIITLAQSLDYGVIAEGVETAEQREFLSNAGCHAFQGYYFSRPISIDAFNEFVKNYK